MTAAGARRVRARVGRGLADRPYHAALAAFVLGLALSPAGASAWAVAATVVLAAVAAVSDSRWTAALAGVLVVGGGALGDARLAAIDAPGRALGEERGSDGVRIDGRVELLESPRPTSFGSQATIRVTAGPLKDAQLLARLSDDKRWPKGAGPGAELAVHGRARRPGPKRDERFDFAAHLRRRGVAGELEVENVAATGRTRGGLEGALDRARTRAEQGMGSGLPPPLAALARGLVLGRDEALDPLVRDDFRRAGLAHLLAASGQNVVLLAALAFPLFAAIGLGHRARIAAVLALIAIYVPLAGASPSLQRAGVMGAAALVALAAGRPASRWYALLLAATVTLALNPRASGDAGWQLSFAAVTGIVALAPGIAGRLRALPRPLAEAVAMTLAATLATAPLLAHAFGSVSLVALPANLLALPAVAPVMWIGTIQTAAAQVPGGLAFDRMLAALSEPPLAYLDWLARRFAELPGAGAEVALPSLPAVLATYAVIAAVVIAVRRLIRRGEPYAAALGGEWRRLPKATRRALTTLAAAGAATAGVLALQPPPRPKELTISFLDVGQGDATLIQDPSGAAVLFDGGPPEARVVHLLRRAGVRTLSVVAATHASRDHHGGLREVVERFPVDVLLDGGDGTADPSYRAMLAAAGRRGIRRVPARAGRTLRVGAIEVRILSPPPRPPGPPPEDPNPRATIALVSARGFELLLSADAESPSLAPLPLPDVDAIKVPHHGSGDPGLPGVLRRMRPQVAAIEVGEENRYGHPHPATLAALHARVPHVLRTDRDGTVRLRVDPHGIEIDRERGD